VQREEFGGRVDLEVRDLPPGVTAQVLPIAEADNAVPVVFTADPKAELRGSLADVVGRAAVGDRKLEGRLRQRTSLVRGQNNREVWNFLADRMAAAVTEATPFQIDLVQPKAPLVQGGSMQLKVRATRQKGFAAPITVSMLYHPPGLSSTNSITIAKDQTEGLLPLTADSGARTGTQPIVVLGQAPVGNGPVLVASQRVDLEVSPPLFRFKFPTVTVEQGQVVELVLAVEKLKDFDGPAKVELLGLPAEATSPSREFTKDAKELVFPIQTTGKSPAGRHRSLLCRAVAMVAGEPVTHLLGTGELRIQQPPPAKPAPQAKAAPPPKPAPPPPRGLSRLEQLRQSRKGASPAPSPAKP
jgi:hypothetical protein